MDCKVEPCNDGGGGEVISEQKYAVMGFEAVRGFSTSAPATIVTSGLDPVVHLSSNLALWVAGFTS
jgi:hypothetical protein